MKKQYLIALSILLTGAIMAACQQIFPQSNTAPVHPLYISHLAVSEKPEIGKEVVIRMEVTSPLEHPDLYIRIDLPKGVVRTAGDLEWTGALAADATISHEVTVCALAPGNWRIPVRTVSTLAQDDFMSDTDALYFIISDEDVMWVREHFVPTDFPDLGAGIAPAATAEAPLDPSVCPQPENQE